MTRGQRSLWYYYYFRYETKEVLGKGLSSVVRRCVCRQTGEEFAVKIIDLAGDDLVDEEGLNQRQLVQREVDILNRVSGHPNIVTLVEVSQRRKKLRKEERTK